MLGFIWRIFLLFCMFYSGFGAAMLFMDGDIVNAIFCLCIFIVCYKLKKKSKQNKIERENDPEYQREKMIKEQIFMNYMQSKLDAQSAEAERSLRDMKLDEINYKLDEIRSRRW